MPKGSRHLFLLLLFLPLLSCSPCRDACEAIFRCLPDDPQWEPGSCSSKCETAFKLARENGYEKPYRELLSCATHLPPPPYCRIQFQQCAAEIPEWIWLKAGFRTRK
jgi:hypothetical protein